MTKGETGRFRAPHGIHGDMCRNIHTLFNFEPPATEHEVRSAAEQYVRKVSVFTKPSRANEDAFARAVDELVLGLDLEERRSGTDGTPGLVHIRLRLQQDELPAVDVDLGELPGELRAPRAAVPPRELVDDEIAGVVPVARVLAARVPQARDEEQGLLLCGSFGGRLF